MVVSFNNSLYVSAVSFSYWRRQTLASAVLKKSLIFKEIFIASYVLPETFVEYLHECETEFENICIISNLVYYSLVHMRPFIKKQRPEILFNCPFKTWLWGTIPGPEISTWFLFYFLVLAREF